MGRSETIGTRRAIEWVGNILIGLGVALLLGTAGLYGYSQYEQAQADREASALGPASASPTVEVLVAAPAASATVAPTTVADVGSRATPESPGGAPSRVVTVGTPTVVATFAPTTTPIPILPAVRVVATAIGLDSKVVESPIVNGEWVVPKFAAGHLQGTAQPLQGSNIVLSGHVQSISSGNVFAQIGNLHPGDVVRLYTNATIVSYVVATTPVVSNNDVQVIQPASSEQVTLITCTGTWLPLQRDYDKRIVVVATRTS